MKGVQPFLLLSIKRVHSERIFAGLKLFELRKILPREAFSHVFLYETKGGGIVGCFDARKPLHRRIDSLWRAVGTKATSKERFEAYFSKTAKGYAIPISNAIRFKAPIALSQIRQFAHSFSVPMSFAVIRPNSSLYNYLFRVRSKHLPLPKVTLRRIRNVEVATFEQLVTAEISRKYDDITPNFAKALIRTDKLGFDPNGIFTTRKNVYTVQDASGNPIGFTTVTTKIGGSAKTGPTILFPQFRQRGFGQAVRQAINSKLRSQGIRKVYCTAPDNDESVIGYLLRSGLQIEAHLHKQYTNENGELVFGDILLPKVPVEVAISRSECRARRMPIHAIAKVELCRFLANVVTEVLCAMSFSTARSLINASLREALIPYEDKPISLLTFGGERRCYGVVILIPKRGGAVKGLLLSKTSSKDSIDEMIEDAQAEVGRRARRKLYFLHPSSDTLVLDSLRRYGFNAEGLLREPYRPGQDVTIMAKLLSMQGT